MTFRQWTDKERTEIEAKIEAVEKEVAGRRAYLDDLKNQLTEGYWVCDIDWQEWGRQRYVEFAKIKDNPAGWSDCANQYEGTENDLWIYHHGTPEQVDEVKKRCKVKPTPATPE